MEINERSPCYSIPLVPARKPEDKGLTIQIDSDYDDTSK